MGSCASSTPAALGSSTTMRTALALEMEGMPGRGAMKCCTSLYRSGRAAKTAGSTSGGYSSSWLGLALGLASGLGGLLGLGLGLGLPGDARGARS